MHCQAKSSSSEDVMYNMGRDDIVPIKDIWKDESEWSANREPDEIVASNRISRDFVLR